MSKASSMMTAIERRIRQRRSAPVHYVMTWGDDDDQMVTDEDGRQMTATEWQRLHPDARVIQMTWGDDDDPPTW